MCRQNRQRKSLAATLITGFVERQAEKRRSLASPEQPFAGSNTIPPTTQIQGTTGYGPAYTAAARGYGEPVNPNPPSYEEVIDEPSDRQGTYIPEKKSSNHEVKYAAMAPLPPHEREYEGYSPNTGLDSGRPLSREISSTSSSDSYDFENDEFPPEPYSETAVQFPPHIQNPTYPTEALPRLLSAIALYFDTQIHMHQQQPATVNILEARKAKAIEGATRLYEDKMSKARDARHVEKINKKAARMEKWTMKIVKRQEAQQARMRSFGAPGFANAGLERGQGYGYGRCGGAGRGFGRGAVMANVGHAPQMMGYSRR